MKIRTRLRLTTLVSVSVVLLIVLSLVWSFSEIFGTDRNMDLIDEMRKVAFERILLRDEYLLHREERSTVQWNAKSATLLGLLLLADTRFKSQNDRALLREAGRDFETTFSLFSRIMERHNKEERATRRELAFSEAELRLIDQVLLKAYSLNDNISRLHESANRTATNARNRGAVIIIVCIIAGGVAIITNSVVINRTLARRIAVLGGGVEIIGKGDLDYRLAVEGDDELSALALASNEMAAKLKALYTSVENLNREIAERKRAEEQLHVLFLRQEAILAAVPDIIMEVDNNKVYRWANQAGLEFFGEGVIGKEANFYFEGEQETYKSVRPLFNGGEDAVYVESWQRRADGEKRLLAWWCRVLKDERGDVKGALSSAQDITERKRAEEALWESERRLSEAQKMAQLGYWIWDVRTGDVEWSEEVFKIFHLDPNHFTPRIDSILALSPWPDDHERDKELIRRAMESHEMGFYEQRFLRPDGSIGYYYSTFQGKFDQQGNLISIIGTVLDITERKQAEEEIRKLNKDLEQKVIERTAKLEAEIEERKKAEGGRSRLVAMLEATTDFVGFAEANDAHILYINKGGRELCGIGYDEDITRLKIADLHPAWANRMLSEEILPTAARDGIWTGECAFLSRDGKEVPVLMVLLAHKNSHGEVEVFSTISRDITGRKSAEEAIRILNEDLKHNVLLLEMANKELEAFSYSVSHDLRAPLRHLAGFVELLNKRAPEALDEKSRHYLNVISESAQQMGKLVDDLLSFSRMGRAEMKKVRVDLDQIAKEALKDLQSEVAGRDIRWKIEPLPEVYGDASMLRLVFVNLINNAIKFTRRQRTAEIEIGCASGDPDEHVFFVKDNGVGFDMRYVDKLFCLFQRLHRLDEFEGTGVGLANVQRIIHRHGGRTWAESAPTGGATFYFSLPKQTAISTQQSAESGHLMTAGGKPSAES